MSPEQPVNSRRHSPGTGTSHAVRSALAVPGFLSHHTVLTRAPVQRVSQSVTPGVFSSLPMKFVPKGSLA
ncbi:hypothetical protein ES703_108885 [subsurface metagenome]